MSSLNSHELLLRFEAGDSQAATAIFDRYIERLLALARARIGPKLARRIDAEDIVQSAYRSFFVHARKQEYALNDAGDLWRLLVRITLNKLYGQVEKHTAARRNIHREDAADPDVSQEPIALEPTAAEAIALTEQLQLVTKGLTSTEQSVLSPHLCGYTIDEIAQVIQKSPRTVRRLLAQMRQKIEKQLIGDGGATKDGAKTRVRCGTDPRAPLSYSDFKLERLLGAGGMGKVYRATQLSTGTNVAIKALLKSRQADTNAVEKFLQEAQILSNLKHPNIVGFRGVGRFPGGGYFIVMDFVDGTDLQSRIARSLLPDVEALRVVRIVAHAIAHAHDRGIVHGDIKPANILIDQANGVVVTDFGLAQFINAAPAMQPWLVGGTAGYIAPEVLSQDCLPGRAADIYGLGALLWALATGSVPNDQDLFCHNTGMVQMLSCICRKCLATDPQQRFKSVRAFIDEIEHIWADS